MEKREKKRREDEIGNKIEEEDIRVRMAAESEKNRQKKKK